MLVTIMSAAGSEEWSSRHPAPGLRRGLWVHILPGRRIGRFPAIAQPLRLDLFSHRKFSGAGGFCISVCDICVNHSAWLFTRCIVDVLSWEYCLDARAASNGQLRAIALPHRKTAITAFEDCGLGERRATASLSAAGRMGGLYQCMRSSPLL
jgi:hypothetical protein